jgi:hydroxymethylpyrimidine pyrophosphatase-like HAD family hydrolase
MKIDPAMPSDERIPASETERKRMKRCERVVLLDLDRTLLDDHSRLNASVEELRWSIRRIQGSNTVVGLNSDTPLGPLTSIARNFGLNGPCLAERGQVLAVAPDQPPIVLGGLTSFFRGLRQQVVVRAVEEIPRAFVAIGDVTEFLNRRGRVHGQDNAAVLVNGYRICSFSAYALTSRGGLLVRDDSFLDFFCDMVFTLVGAEIDRLEVDKNPPYGIVILHQKGASKTTAFERLVELLGQHIEYFMVGDSDSDIIKSQYPVRLCAVGNASPALKEQATKTGGIVAEASFARGVLEILAHLSERPCRSAG